MAVTRIKNNQITDAISGNVQNGVNAAAKLQNYSITSTKIANSLVYGSDLTVSGNLTVNGTTTTIDTINTLIEDPIITLADGQTSGSPAVDIGILGLRGSQNSSFLGWNEANTQFAAVLSNTTASNTVVNITQYADFKAANISATGNLSVAGNITGSANFTGNITAGNILTPGIVSAAGNVTGGNVNTAGLISATGNLTSGNVNTAGLVTATGNVTGGNILTAGIVSSTGNATHGNVLTGGIVSATGNIYGGNVSTAGNVTAAYFIGNIQGNIDAAGANTQIQFNTTGDILGANANFTYDYATNLMTVNGGNINTGNLSATGQVVSTANITGGNILTGGLVSATGNVTGGNIRTSGNVDATSAFVNAGAVLASGRVEAGTTMSAAGNITSATNVNTPNVVATANLSLSTSGSGNINLSPTSGNIVVNSTYINGVAQPVQSNDVATKIYVDNMVSTQIAYHPAVFAATTANLATTTGGTITYNQPNGAGNGVGATLTVSGGTFNLIDTANVQSVGTRILVKNEANAAFNGAYVWSNATVLTRSTDADQYGPNSSEELSINDYFFVQSGNVNKGSAYIVDAPNGTITFGTSNISFAQFSSSQTYTGGNGISLYGTVISTVYDNNTIGVNGSNQLYVPPNATFTTPNIGAATGISLSLTGNATAGNLLTGGLVSSTGNITGGNILTAGLISAAGNITTSSTLNTANISLSGNVISPLNVTGNTTSGNLLTPGLISAAGNINTSANINQTGTGNINGYNGYFSNNLTVIGTFQSTGNIIANVAGIFYGNSVTGNGALYAGVPGYTVLGSNVVAQFAGNANSYSQINFQNISNGTSASTDYIATADNGTDTSYYVDVGINSSTFNDPVNYPGFGPNDSYVHNHGGNLILNPETAGKAINFMVGGTANANVIGYVNASGLFVTGVVSTTGNITGPNVVGTTSGKFGNIVISGDNITDTNGRVNFNTALGDVDFAVNGSANANVFYVDAGTGTASFGNSTQVTNAIVSFNTTNSIVLPVGNLAVRPATGVTGMIRFNTTNNGLEIYDNSEWTPVGTTVFTVIADEQFNGDGSTVAFTLASSQTTNSCIVSINGIVQVPGSAYSVSGTFPTCVLTFTEAPASGDLIDVREVTTTTTVSALANASGNAEITGNPYAASFDVTGNLVPTGNAAYSLGNASHYWSSLYVGGNTIYLGGLQLKSATGNVFNVYASDGSTPAVLGNTTISTTGTICVGGIINGGANASGNIGNATGYFNTVFAKATSAQYADLAEKYVADSEYAPGTVLSFGGEKEVTRSTKDSDRAVAGVVSTNPSYIMNATLDAEHVATIALTGRVPTSVTGTVAKGDLMVSNGDGTARSEADPKAGAIIGKALEDFTGETGVIEVVIGRF